MTVEPMDDMDETTASQAAMEHHAAHVESAKAAGMSPQQFAMKHQNSDGMAGHRARLHHALHGLKRHDAMHGTEEERDAFDSAMERNQK